MKDVKEFGSKYIFMPDATRGAVRNMTTKQIEDVGVEGMVVNTLHLMISPGSERIKLLGGIHEFMNWDGYTLSDSGGFQVFSLIHTGKWHGKITDEGATFKSPRNGDTHLLTPERSIDVQMELGTDVIVLLDDCRKAEVTRAEAEESVRNTLLWVEKAYNHLHENYPSSLLETKKVSAVVQGGNFLDLRESCAKELSKYNFDGYNFGGYVVDEQGNLVVDQMKAVLENTPDTAFKYAMGVGKPEDIFESAKLGYTVFDTVIPTRNARHGTLYSSSEASGILKVLNAEYATDERPIDAKCDCEACTNHTRAYVHQMLKIGEATGMTLATIHNMRFYQRVIEGLNSGLGSESDYLSFLQEI